MICYIMKQTFLLMLILLIGALSTFSQSYNPYQKFESLKNPYSVTIPVSFQKKEPIGNNIDMKFTDGFGSSITVNVTNRLKEEYSITAHDYTKAFLEQTNRPIFPNYTVISTSKILLDGQKAFLVESIGSSAQLKEIECYLYYKDKAYLVTCTAPIIKFENYRPLFEKAIHSIDFE